MFDWLSKGKKEKSPKQESDQILHEADSISLSDSNSKSEQEILDWLVQKLAALNSLEPSQIDVNKSFSYYGLDSVAAVGLAGELEEWLERKFSATLLFTLLFSRPSIANLATHLAGAGGKQETSEKRDG